MKRLNVNKTVRDLENFYDDLASRMGAGWQKSMYRAPHQLQRYNKIIEIYNHMVRPEDRVLELGSANGIMTADLAKKAAHVDAVEISSVAISDSPELDNVTYHHADVIEFLKTNSVKYDIIVATEVLEHVTDFEEAIKLCLASSFFTIVSMPISEELNPEGAFDSSRVGRETRVGDATGHLRITTPDELASNFETLYEVWDNGVSVVVAGN